MKTVCKYMIFICALFIISAAAAVNVSASVIFIESHNKTIASGHVTASTFKDAVLELCAEKGINVIFSSNGEEILSVNEIPNNIFSVYDCWQGYIIRDNAIQQASNILSAPIQPKDILVLYYGHISDTKIVTDLDFYEINGKLNFNLSSSSVQWYENNGEWTSGIVTESLENVKINITEPGGTRKIVQTNQDGYAECPLLSGGVYKFYAEGYNYGIYPSIVRTVNHIYFYSLSEDDNITRAEACAFLVQALDLKQGTNKKSFSDVNADTEYVSEIETAASNDLVSGFENGEFKPDEPVNLLQLGIMISKLYPEGDYAGIQEESLPGWAQEAALKIMSLGLFDDIGYNWLGPVTKNDLSVIYRRLICGAL